MKSDEKDDTTSQVNKQNRSTDLMLYNIKLPTNVLIVPWNKQRKHT